MGDCKAGSTPSEKIDELTLRLAVPSERTFTTSMGFRKTLETSDAMPAAHPRCHIVSSLSGGGFSSPLRSDIEGAPMRRCLTCHAAG